MTFFGRLLVVLLLVLSVCFMSLALAVFSATTNWRELARQRQEAVEAADKSAREAEEQFKIRLADVTSRLDTTKEELDLKIGQNEQLGQELQLARNEITAAKTAVDTQTEVAKLAAAEADARKAESLAARVRNETLNTQFAAVNARLRAIEDELFAKEGTLETAVARNGDLLDELGAVRSFLRENGLNPENAFGADEPAPEVEGVVTAVQDSSSGSQTFVAISLGSDDGLRRGDELVVVSDEGGGKYLGTIRLIETRPDEAVGEVIGRNPTGLFQKGNRVSTQF